MASKRRLKAIETPESLIVEHTQEIIDNVDASKNEEYFIEEYKVLSKHYVKLNKRMDKVLKINDKQNLSIMNDNENLEEDKNKILQTSKKKIMSSISANREQIGKHSEQTAQYAETIAKLQAQVSKSQEKAIKLEKALQSTMQNLTVSKTKVVKLEDATEKLKAKISVLKGDTTVFHQVLEKQIVASRESQKALIIGLFGIDDYVKTKGKILEFIAEEKFISAMIKYLQNSLTKNYTVIYFESGVFFIMAIEVPMPKVLEKFKEVGRKKIIQGNSISFSGCFAHLTQDDTADSVSERTFEEFYSLLETEKQNEVIQA